MAGSSTCCAPTVLQLFQPLGEQVAEGQDSGAEGEGDDGAGLGGFDLNRAEAVFEVFDAIEAAFDEGEAHIEDELVTAVEFLLHGFNLGGGGHEDLRLSSYKKQYSVTSNQLPVTSNQLPVGAGTLHEVIFRG